MRFAKLSVCILAAISAAGCGETEDPIVAQVEDPAVVQADVDPIPKPMSKMPTDAKDIHFKDEVSSNVEIPKSVSELEFVDTNGEKVAIGDFEGKKNVVLVFTEGFNKMLCPFCKTQTSRLISNYKKFEALDTEVLVVYPGKTDHLDEFILAAKTTDKKQVDNVPFPIVLDQDYKAVDFFDIRSSLAHPSTYIINKNGVVVLAYVGADMTADRPSVKAMLDKLAAANGQSR